MKANGGLGRSRGKKGSFTGPHVIAGQSEKWGRQHCKAPTTTTFQIMMVFPSLGCLTCKRRRVKVKQRAMFLSLSVADATSMIRPDLFVSNAAEQAEVVPGKPVEKRACHFGARMLLLRASPDVREVMELLRGHEMQLLCLQQHPLRSHHPYLSP